MDIQTSPSDVRSPLRSPALLAWLRLVRVFVKVDRASSEELRTWRLSVAQFDVLAHVGAAEGITQQELATRLLVTKGNVCQLLDRMERADWLERRQEGRANRLYLTDTGRRLYREVVPAHEAVITRQFAALSAEEQIQLHTLLRTLDRALE
ncbi:MAG: MarR family transcriptional regulator [Ktedonobacterales bacterium]|nr:MarR family transcriptional regulator [Ktedonobacterales bacterium]